MNRGDKLWVLVNNAAPYPSMVWVEAIYEFRIEHGEPLGQHSVMLSNGGGRRILSSAYTSTVDPRGGPQKERRVTFIPYTEDVMPEPIEPEGKGWSLAHFTAVNTTTNSHIAGHLFFVWERMCDPVVMVPE